MKPDQRFPRGGAPRRWMRWAPLLAVLFALVAPSRDDAESSHIRAGEITRGERPPRPLQAERTPLSCESPCESNDTGAIPH